MNPWSSDSLNTRQTQFTREEIDNTKVTNYNVELLLDSMYVGETGTDFKPKGLTPMIPSIDMVQQYESIQASNPFEDPNVISRKKRTFIPRYATHRYMWPNGEISYYIEQSTFTNYGLLRSLIQQAIDNIESHTCIKFIEKNSTEAAQNDFDGIVFVDQGPNTGCFTRAGYRYDLTRGQFKHFINLDETTWFCLTVRAIIHELGHVIGMLHEMTRPDRNEHLTISKELIIQKTYPQFEKQLTKMRVPFDYASVMMYSFRAGSINYHQPGMEIRDPSLQFLIEYVDGYLTYYDSMNVIKAYRCNNGCPTKNCDNGAIRNHGCECVCPEGLRGPTCNQVINADICGGIIEVRTDTHVVVDSPDFNSTFTADGAQCYWLLKAPEESAITIEIERMDLLWNNISKRCYHWLEISYNLIGQRGPKYCGDSFPKGKISTSKFGEPNLMLLKLDTKSVSGLPQVGGFRIRGQAYNAYKGNNQGCSLPPTVENATNNYHIVGRQHGAIVKYKCEGDYTMFGQGHITCHADGTWSRITFRCELREPIFDCDFSNNNCSITVDIGIHSWKRFAVEGDTFFRVDPPINYQPFRYQVDFRIDVLFKPYTEYCVSASIYRPLGQNSCASYYIFTYSVTSIAHIGSSQCYDTEWTTYKASFTTSEENEMMIVAAIAMPGTSFNLDVDNIVIREGSCNFYNWN